MQHHRYRAMAACIVATVLASAAHAAGEDTAEARKQRDQIVFMQDSHPEMKRAFERARSTLDDFLKKAANPPAGTQSYAVKVGVTEKGDTEYFWINELQPEGERYSGLINNEPNMVRSVRFGQRYVFEKSQIVDWTYVDRSSKRMMGNYTACALLTRESPESAQAFKARYGLSCD